MNKCDQCGGDKYIIQDGERVDCSCVKVDRAKQYLEGVGKTSGKPNKKYRDLLEENSDKLFPQSYIKLHKTFSQTEKNSLVAYLLYMHHYPNSYRMFSVGELREFLKEQEWKKFRFEEDLLIIYPNERGDFSSRDWIKSSYKEILGQIIRSRIAQNKSLWIVSNSIEFPSVEKMIHANDFHIINFSEYISDDMRV